VASWRKIIRVVHRDAGYFFVGMTVIYAVSGIALNHIRDWNSNYEIVARPVSIAAEPARQLTDDDARRVLKSIGVDARLKSHYAPTAGTRKIFFEGGSVEWSAATGDGVVERLKRRPVLFELNLLHYNPGPIWTWFSDVYCLSLVVIAVTGLFVLKGKKGIRGRGAWLCGAGVVVPVILLLLYL